MNINLNSGMTNFKVRRQNFGVGTLLFLLLLGAAFTGGGIFALRSNKVDPDWTRVTGEVVDSSSHISDGTTMYSPIVKYQVDGQPHKVGSSISSSAYPTIGKQQEIAYNPARPDQSKVVESSSSQLFIYLFPLIGILCIVSAPYYFVRSAKRGGNIKQLMQGGQKVQGVLVDIQSEGSNSSKSYKIIVAATDHSGVVQNYVSDTLTGIGGLAMADFRNIPIPIDVYVDPTNPQNYYVNIADIPNLTAERIGELLKLATQNSQSIVPATQVQPSTPPINPTFPPSQT